GGLRYDVVCAGSGKIAAPGLIGDGSGARDGRCKGTRRRGAIKPGNDRRRRGRGRQNSATRVGS
nr:hypothetical protein [Tanacetum cinerariifolium]